MKIINQKVDEVRNVLWRIASFCTLLDLIIVFLLSAIILLLINIPLVYAVIPAAFIFVVQVVRSRSTGRKTVDIVGDKYPSLEEKLKTAYDSEDGCEGNVIVNSLISDVSEEIEEVESGSFFNTKKTSMRVFLAIFLMFCLLIITTLSFPEIDLNFDVDAFGGISPASSMYGEGNGSGIGAGAGAGAGAGTGEMKDIYGEVSVAAIEGEKIQMEIHPEYGDELGIDESGKTKTETPFSTISSAGYEAVSAESYKENIPVEDETVVRKYFEKLAED